MQLIRIQVIHTPRLLVHGKKLRLFGSLVYPLIVVKVPIGGFRSKLKIISRIYHHCFCCYCWNFWYFAISKLNYCLTPYTSLTILVSKHASFCVNPWFQRQNSQIFQQLSQNSCRALIRNFPRGCFDIIQVFPDTSQFPMPAHFYRGIPKHING